MGPVPFQLLFLRRVRYFVNFAPNSQAHTAVIIGTVATLIEERQRSAPRAIRHAAGSNDITSSLTHTLTSARTKIRLH